MPNWNKEHFMVRLTVAYRRKTKRRVYKLVDYNNGYVKGSWYLEEIQEFQTTSTASIKYCRGAIYLTTQYKYSYG